MPALRFILIVLTGLLALPAGTIAQSLPQQWEQTAGPPGGTFAELAQDPITRNLWASVEGAVYFSRDGGASWTLALAEDLGKTVFAFDGPSIFAGPFVSHDAGINWQRHQLADSLIIQDYAYDPVSDHLFAATDDGLFSSSDNGATWTKRISSAIKRIWSFDGKFLFAATTTEFPWWLYSDDNGKNWQTLRLGTPISIAQGPDNILYLMHAVRDDTTFFRSTNNGTRWLNGGPGTCGGRELIGFTPNQELLYLYDGIVKLSIEDNSVCKRIYLNQKTFSTSTIRKPVQAWLLGHDDVLYVDTGFGEFIKSSAGDAAWEQMAVKGIAGTSVHTITIDEDTGQIWAGTALHGLFSSTDTGETWTHHGFSGHIIQATSNGNTPALQWLASNQDGLLNWNQTSQNWEAYAPGGIQLAAVPPIYDPATQTAFFRTKNNVFYAKAGENTLTGIPTPASFFDSPAIAVTTLGADGTLYAIIRHKPILRQKGFFRLTSPTGSWEMVSDNFPGAFTETSLLVMDSSMQLWASSDSSLYMSADKGSTWARQDISTGMINDILETPDGAIWVAHARGLYQLKQGFDAWTPVDTGRNHKAVLSLAWHEKEGLLLAGTARGGLYKMSLAPPVEVASEAIQHKRQYLEAGHFPNPAQATATIHFTLARTETVRIQLFDQLGRVVRQVTNAQFPAGKHNVDLSFASLSPGVYLYKIETSTEQLTRLITHVR